MKIENTVINQNDNAEFLGSVYLGTDEFGNKSRRLQYRALALSLIDKYLPAYRKSRLEECHLMEAHIVETIDDAYQAYKQHGTSWYVGLCISELAVFLEAPRIQFYNDSILPAFMQGYPLPALK